MAETFVSALGVFDVEVEHHRNDLTAYEMGQSPNEGLFLPITRPFDVAACHDRVANAKQGLDAIKHL